MFTSALNHLKMEAKRVVKYTAVFGAIGTVGSACCAKIIFREFKDSLSNDIIRQFHERHPYIPSRFHALTDRVVLKIFDQVFNKSEDEVVTHLAVYGAISGVSFGFSIGLLRITVGFVRSVFRSILSRRLKS